MIAECELYISTTHHELLWCHPFICFLVSLAVTKFSRASLTCWIQMRWSHRLENWCSRGISIGKLWQDKIHPCKADVAKTRSLVQTLLSDSQDRHESNSTQHSKCAFIESMLCKHWYSTSAQWHTIHLYLTSRSNTWIIICSKVTMICSVSTTFPKGEYGVFSLKKLNGQLTLIRPISPNFAHIVFKCVIEKFERIVLLLISCFISFYW